MPQSTVQELSNLLLGNPHGTLSEMIEAVKLLQAKCEFLSLGINTLRQAHDKTSAITKSTQAVWDTFERQWQERGFSDD